MNPSYLANYFKGIPSNVTELKGFKAVSYPLSWTGTVKPNATLTGQFP